MKKYIILYFLALSCSNNNLEKTELPLLGFEKTDGKETATYKEAIEFFELLAKENESISISKKGLTDVQLPLHLVKYSSPNSTKNPLKIFINNGIHPGESDGIDASMLLFREIATGNYSIPDHVEIYCIPVYNIGGALNRNKHSRVNQNGPESYGFRGNAKNFDLNRDFIKTDTENMLSFAQIYHEVNPDILIDTHVSNGADYQYTLTHLYTQANKLGGKLGDFWVDELQPAIKTNLKSKGYEMTPYVNVFNRPPNEGFNQFLDTPRYSTGYTSLWNTLGVMIETHMLKPYPERVEATLAKLKGIIEEGAVFSSDIKNLRTKNFDYYLNSKTYPISFKLDSSKFNLLNFKGYEYGYKKSKVTGQDRLFYDTLKPIEIEIPYYSFYSVAKEVTIPKAYYIPSAYTEIIDLLDVNAISYQKIEKNEERLIETYTIEDFSTYTTPYEGHYPHYNTEVSIKKENSVLPKGGYLVPTNQRGIRYIIETLEPEAVDSFFNWNFFDAILQQKEGFSPYVFEELAYEVLEENQELKKAFLQKKEAEQDFNENAYQQLNWIFKNSKYYEESHRRYPILRVF